MEETSHTCGTRSVVLYAHPSMHDLALAVISSCEVTTPQRLLSLRAPSFTDTRTGCTEVLVQTQASSSEQRLARRSVKYWANGIRWNKFQDGFPDLFLEGVKSLAGRDGNLHKHTEITARCFVQELVVHCQA